METRQPTILLLAEGKGTELDRVIRQIIDENIECPTTVVCDVLTALLDYGTTSPSNDKPSIDTLRDYGLTPHIADMYMSKRIVDLVWKDILLYLENIEVTPDCAFEVNQDNFLLEGTIGISIMRPNKWI